MRHRTSRRHHLRRTAAGLSLALVASGAVALAAPAAAQDAAGPAVAVSKTTGLAESGETLTVTGSGFDPQANRGTRPPLAGQPAGVYVVFGRFADEWRPSEGAPSSARGGDRAVDTRWALPAGSRAVMDPTGTDPQFATIGEDGTFELTLDAAPAPDTVTDGRYGVYTYPGSGAVNAAYELFVATEFGPDEAPGPVPTGVPTAPSGPAEPDPTPTASPAPSASAEPGPGASPAPAPAASTAPPAAPVSDGSGLPASGVITAGTLEWGVKSSFRSYVTGPIARGAATPSGGASASADGFAFPEGTGSTVDDAVEAAFAGAVRFTGHDSGDGPVLDVTFSAPRVVLDGAAGVLVLDVVSRPFTGATAGAEPGEPERHEAVEFATLDLRGVAPVGSGGVLTLAGIPAVLTEEGAQASGFDAFYSEPEQRGLDPLTLVLAVDGAALDLAAGPATTRTVAALPRTGGLPAAVLPVGLALVVLGAGLVVAARRPVAA